MTDSKTIDDRLEEVKRNWEKQFSQQPATEEGKRQKATILFDAAAKICGQDWLFTHWHKAHAALKSPRPIDSPNVYQVVEVDSGAFRRYITYIGHRIDRNTPGKETVNTVVRLAEAKAEYEGEGDIDLHNRVARNTPGFLFDVGGKLGNVIRIEPGRWTRETYHKPKFKRYRHQKKIILPSFTEDIDTPEARCLRLERLFEVINHDPDYRELFLVDFVASFIPDIPQPISVFFGSEGSGKTTVIVVYKKLLDPSIMESLMLNKRQERLVQNLAHHYCVAFDNVGTLWDWQSDLLCRAVTGAGFAKRKLYSDDDDVIYAFKRKIMLTGINNPASNPDFLDRSILYELPSIQPNERLTEAEVKERLEELTPSIMTAVFSTLSEAMTRIHEVELDHLYRMADFTKWLVAIALSLDIDHTKVLEQYGENQQKRIQQAIDNDLIGSLIVDLLDNPPLLTKTEEDTEKDRWPKGGPIKETPTQFYNSLCERAELEGIKTEYNDDWPGSPSALGRRLSTLEESLSRLDPPIRFEKSRPGGSQRIYVFERLTTEQEEFEEDNGEEEEEEEPIDDIVKKIASTLLPNEADYLKKRSHGDPWKAKPEDADIIEKLAGNELIEEERPGWWRLTNKGRNTIKSLKGGAE